MADNDWMGTFGKASSREQTPWFQLEAHLTVRDKKRNDSVSTLVNDLFRSGNPRTTEPATCANRLRASPYINWVVL